MDSELNKYHDVLWVQTLGQLKVRHCYNAGLLPLPVINFSWMVFNVKLCITKACSVGGKVTAGFWNINNSEQ